ncbi:MAG: hypothetical protein BWY96_01103 [Spirochaetes bacterium ADurb.BinA120]|nr:MAG: hypothetical protein BWY96_01103 [Spirochaetes bacterium ADurb.BinA120]OQB81368.1 MAG: hypothetical protein BWX88_04305 [Planctomycetes bacterium ADurb.Bin126]
MFRLVPAVFCPVIVTLAPMLPRIITVAARRAVRLPTVQALPMIVPAAPAKARSAPLRLPRQ